MSRSFELSVHNEVLRELYINGIDSNEAITFFIELFKTMQNYEPNYGPQKNNNVRRHKYPFHLCKGFYPGTAVMFRAILLDKEHFDIPLSTKDSHSMYAKVSKAKCMLPKTLKHSTRLNESEQLQLMDHKAEKFLLDNKKPLEQKFAPKFKAPRCISPKGMPILNLKKKV